MSYVYRYLVPSSLLLWCKKLPPPLRSWVKAVSCHADLNGMGLIPHCQRMECAFVVKLACLVLNTDKFCGVQSCKNTCSSQLKSVACLISEKARAAGAWWIRKSLRVSQTYPMPGLKQDSQTVRGQRLFWNWIKPVAEQNSAETQALWRKQVCHASFFKRRTKPDLAKTK